MSAAPPSALRAVRDELALRGDSGSSNLMGARDKVRHATSDSVAVPSSASTSVRLSRDGGSFTSPVSSVGGHTPLGNGSPVREGKPTACPSRSLTVPPALRSSPYTQPASLTKDGASVSRRDALRWQALQAVVEAPLDVLRNGGNALTSVGSMQRGSSPRGKRLPPMHHALSPSAFTDINASGPSLHPSSMPLRTLSPARTVLPTLPTWAQRVIHGDMKDNRSLLFSALDPLPMPSTARTLSPVLRGSATSVSAVARDTPAAVDPRSPLLEAPYAQARAYMPSAESDIIMMAASEGVVYHEAFAALDADGDGWLRPGDVARFVHLHQLPFVVEADALEVFVTAAALEDRSVADKEAVRKFGHALPPDPSLSNMGGLDYFRWVRVMRADGTGAFKRLALVVTQIKQRRADAAAMAMHSQPHVGATCAHGGCTSLPGGASDDAPREEAFTGVWDAHGELLNFSHVLTPDTLTAEPSVAMSGSAAYEHESKSAHELTGPGVQPAAVVTASFEPARPGTESSALRSSLRSQNQAQHVDMESEQAGGPPTSASRPHSVRFRSEPHADVAQEEKVGDLVAATAGSLTARVQGASAAAASREAITTLRTPMNSILHHGAHEDHLLGSSAGAADASTPAHIGQVVRAAQHAGVDGGQENSTEVPGNVGESRASTTHQLTSSTAALQSLQSRVRRMFEGVGEYDDEIASMYNEATRAVTAGASRGGARRSGGGSADADATSTRGAVQLRDFALPRTGLQQLYDRDAASARPIPDATGQREHLRSRQAASTAATLDALVHVERMTANFMSADEATKRVAPFDSRAAVRRAAIKELTHPFKMLRRRRLRGAWNVWAAVLAPAQRAAHGESPSPQMVIVQSSTRQQPAGQRGDMQAQSRDAPNGMQKVTKTPMMLPDSDATLRGIDFHLPLAAAAAVVAERRASVTVQSDATHLPPPAAVQPLAARHNDEHRRNSADSDVDSANSVHVVRTPDVSTLWRDDASEPQALEQHGSLAPLASLPVASIVLDSVLTAHSVLAHGNASPVADVVHRQQRASSAHTIPTTVPNAAPADLPQQDAFPSPAQGWNAAQAGTQSALEFPGAAHSAECGAQHGDASSVEADTSGVAAPQLQSQALHVLHTLQDTREQHGELQVSDVEGVATPTWSEIDAAERLRNTSITTEAEFEDSSSAHAGVGASKNPARDAEHATSSNSGQLPQAAALHEPQWVQVNDPETGYDYFYCLDTEESAWELPRAPPLAADMPLSPTAQEAGGYQVCIECETQLAARKCTHCGGDCFCTACFAHFHAKGKKRGHAFSLVRHPPGLTGDMPKPAAVSLNGDWHTASLASAVPPLPLDTSGQSADAAFGLSCVTPGDVLGETSFGELPERAGGGDHGGEEPTEKQHRPGASASAGEGVALSLPAFESTPHPSGDASERNALQRSQSLVVASASQASGSRTVRFAEADASDRMSATSDARRGAARAGDAALNGSHVGSAASVTSSVGSTETPQLRLSLRRFASSSSMAAADATSPAISGASPVPGSSGRQGKGKVTWYAYYDASSRLPYYYQPESGETVWELPTGNATIIPMTPSVTRQIAVSGNTSGMGTKKRSTVLMPSPAVLSSARNYLRGDKV